MVFAVGAGDKLVGRTDVCNYPPEARSVPIVGGFGKPSLERLIELKPDAVLEIALEDESLGAKMDDLGLHRERIQCGSLKDIPSAMRRVADIAGTIEQGKQAAEAMEKAIADRIAADSMRQASPRVLVEIWGDPVMTAGKGTFISDVIRLAGGDNVGDAGEAEYFQVTSEWVVKMDPDIILCFYMAEGGNALGRISSRIGWGGVKAVINRRVYDGFPNDIMLRPGPRAIEAVDVLERVIWSHDEK
jgi:iron complex transport system substrate-binding protein